MSETEASAELRTIAIVAAGGVAPAAELATATDVVPEAEAAPAPDVAPDVAPGLAPEAGDCGIALWVALASPSMNASRAANLTDLDIMKNTCAKGWLKARAWLT